ncbi:MAG: vWA domain-containing protein [Byssovorax sp.]
MIIARRRPSRALSLSALTLLSGVSLASGIGCSANKTTGTFGTGGTAAETVSATTGATGTGGNGEGGSILVGATGSGTGSGGSGGQEACAQATAEAKLIPLSIFVAVDQSGSMSDSGKWDNVKTAFTTFFQDPNAGGIGVALRFWPDPSDFGNPNPPIACNDDVDFTCGAGVVASCETPEVDVGLLSDPAHVKSLVDSFNAHSPNGSTPTSAALDGATKWTAKYVFAHNHTEQAIVLLVTDGEPTTCNTDPIAINAIATKALSGAGVLTFAVGLAGSNQATMDGIASAGGTGQAFMIGNGNAAADLLVALKKIQANAVACSFAMPLPPNPKDEIDLNQVDVSYTPSNGGVKTKFPQVASAAACSALGGWYYDNPTKPTTINLCPASCTKVQIDTGAKVDIFLGCIKKSPT